MNPDSLSDEQVLRLVGEADRELFEAGLDIKQRCFEVPSLVMRRLGYINYVLGSGKPGIAERIESAFRSIYRRQDIATGGHIGVFMYRDVFARFGAPMAFGRVSIEPFEFVDLTPVQLRIIQTEPAEMETYRDQFWDVMDIQYGLREIRPNFSKSKLVKRFLGLAKLNLHAAAAILTGGFDYRGAVQSALIASELGLKAGVAAQGLGEERIKQFGHRSQKLSECVAANWSTFDIDRVGRVLSQQPRYVLNRYSSEHPGRREVGHIAMGAQYLVSEVVRQLSRRNFRENFDSSTLRRYPA